MPKHVPVSFRNRRVRVVGPHRLAGRTGWVVDSGLSSSDATEYAICFDGSEATTWAGLQARHLELTHTIAEDRAERQRMKEAADARAAQRLPDVSGRAHFARLGRRRH